MRKIEDALVVRVTVYGAHESMRDSEFVMQNLRHWSQAIRGAARIGNNLVLRRIKNAVVDANTNRRVRILAGALISTRLAPAFNAVRLCPGW